MPKSSSSSSSSCSSRSSLSSSSTTTTTPSCLHHPSMWGVFLWMVKLVIYSKGLLAFKDCSDHCLYPPSDCLSNRPQTDEQPSSSSSSSSMTTSSPPRPVAAPSTAPSNQGSHSRQSSAPLGGTKPASLPPNLDEMKVSCTTTYKSKRKLHK